MSSRFALASALYGGAMGRWVSKKISDSVVGWLDMYRGVSHDPVSDRNPDFLISCGSLSILNGDQEMKRAVVCEEEAENEETEKNKDEKSGTSPSKECLVFSLERGSLSLNRRKRNLVVLEAECSFLLEIDMGRNHHRCFFPASTRG
jgi:hypothetical protein